MASIPRNSITNGGGEDSPMDLDEEQLLEPENEKKLDAFLKFIDYARSILSPADEEDGESSDTEEKERKGPGWSWIASRVLKTCISYSSGVTAAILLSELSQAWNEHKKISAPRTRPECIRQLKRNHRRAKLPNTVTIDTIYEKNFLSLDSVLEVVVVDIFVLEGTNIYMLTLGDFWSSNTIDLYLHRRYYDLASTKILKKGREVFLTGCYLRSTNQGSGCLRLLPTEYFVTLLDEDQDDDALLIVAGFYSDSFTSVSQYAANPEVHCSLYTRIKSIGPLEILDRCGSGSQKKQIRLVDNEGVEMNFVLWGEQAMLANLFSVGSTLAIDRPFIASSLEDVMETCGDPWLEFGHATQLYLVPFVQQEEQVCVALTPNRLQGSRFATTSYPRQCPKVSQMTLPCDSQGTVDFSNYPFQSLIIDLHDKMTGVSIYGVVMDIFRETNTDETVFNLRIQDATGMIWTKLHFSESWSLGRLSLGHTIYISGLTCIMTKEKHLEARWFEDDLKTSFINISNLPAILNSSCLHLQSYLADLPRQNTGTQICSVWLDQTEHWHVDTRLVHVACGHFVKETRSGSAECEFCCCCATQTRRAFHLKVTVADESGKAFAWCTGQTAMEVLQISPDEFYELPEEEQVIYPCSLENERYVVAIVNCGQQDAIFKQFVTTESDMAPWEITRALKI